MKGLDAALQGSEHDALRSSWEAVRRSAEDHLDALRTFESHLEEAFERLAEERQAMAQEREAMAQEREALADGPATGAYATGTYASARCSPPRSPEGRLQEAIGRLRLDDDARHGLERFPATQALELLDQVSDKVRNPSAFVTKMCSRIANQPQQSTHRSRSRSPRPTSIKGVLEDTIWKLKLDESATRGLHQFPPVKALRMLEQVGSDVRNPSAFVTKMCSRALQEGPDRPSSRGPSDLDASISRLALDASAARLLKDLPLDEARNIVDQLGDDVRNPSALVTAEARKALSKKRSTEERPQRKW